MAKRSINNFLDASLPQPSTTSPPSSSPPSPPPNKRLLQRYVDWFTILFIVICVYSAGLFLSLTDNHFIDGAGSATRFGKYPRILPFTGILAMANLVTRIRLTVTVGKQLRLVQIDPNTAQVLQDQTRQAFSFHYETMHLELTRGYKATTVRKTNGIRDLFQPWVAGQSGPNGPNGPSGVSLWHPPQYDHSNTDSTVQDRSL